RAPHPRTLQRRRGRRRLPRRRRGVARRDTPGRPSTHGPALSADRPRPVPADRCTGHVRQLVLQPHLVLGRPARCIDRRPRPGRPHELGPHRPRPRRTALDALRRTDHPAGRPSRGLGGRQPPDGHRQGPRARRAHKRRRSIAGRHGGCRPPTQDGRRGRQHLAAQVRRPGDPRGRPVRRGPRGTPRCPRMGHHARRKDLSGRL
ncbi:uncharacterized protein METZ01_LOCUS369769, partial [marine metagenome]